MKRYHRYQMDFSGKWLAVSVVFMAVSFFATMVYYFGIINLADLGFFRFLFCGLIPCVLSAAFVFFIRFQRRNAPGIYGILGAALCLCYLISSFYTGNAFRIFLGIVWYLLAGVLVLACTGGYLPNLPVVSVAFAVSIAVRLVIFPVGVSLDVVSEIAVLCSMVSLMFLPLSLKTVRKRN